MIQKTFLSSRLLLLAVFVATLLFPIVTFGYTTILRSNTQECYSEQMKKDETFTITYEVANDNLPVDFMIMDPTSRVLAAKAHTPDGRFEYKASIDGKFTYCFKAPAGNDLIVNFNPHSPEDEIDFGQFGKKEGTEIQREIKKLATNIDDMIDHFQNMIARDNVRYQSGALTQSRIFSWSLMQSVALIGVCGWQIYYLSSIFKTRAIV